MRPARASLDGVAMHVKRREAQSAGVMEKKRPKERVRINAYARETGRRVKP